MRKKLIISLVLAGALAGIPGMALAEPLEYSDDNSARSESTQTEHGCGTEVLDRVVPADEPSADDLNMADGRTGGVLEGTG